MIRHLLYCPKCKTEFLVNVCDKLMTVLEETAYRSSAEIARPALIGAAAFETPEIGVHRDLICIQPERKDFIRHGEIVFVGKLIHGVSSCSSGWKS